MQEKKFYAINLNTPKNKQNKNPDLTATIDVKQTADSPVQNQDQSAADAKKRKRDLPVHERPDFWLMILTGCLMSFQAGYINVIAILKTQNTVSHITGTASRVGINLAHGDFSGLTLALGLLTTFLAGGTLIGFFIRKQVFHFNRKYGIFLILEAFMLYLFKSALDSDSPRTALLFGSFACGVQNALLTNLSGAVVRTTHVTGLMTDTGLVLGNYLRFKDQCKDVWRLKVLVPILLTYILGSFFSAIFFAFYDYKAVNFAISFIAGFGILIVSWRLLKRYKIDTFKELKHQLLGDSIDLKKNVDEVNFNNNNKSTESSKNNNKILVNYDGNGLKDNL